MKHQWKVVGMVVGAVAAGALLVLGVGGCLYVRALRDAMGW